MGADAARVTAPSVSARLPGPVLAAVLTQTVISAGTYLAAKRAMEDFDPIALVVWRSVLAALVLGGVLLALPERRLPPRRALPWLIGFGFLVGPVNQGLFIWGLSRSKATHASLLYALTPIGVYLLSLALRRERATVLRLAGIACALTGVVVLLLGHGLAGATGPLVGDLFILGAVAAWVVFTIESRAFATEHGGLRTAAWSVIAAGLWLVPVAPFVWSAEVVARASAAAWWCLAYLVLLTSVVAYVLWNYAIVRTDASRVAVFANLQPVLTAVAAFFLLGEPIGWQTVAGGVMVLLGVRLAQG